MTGDSMALRALAEKHADGEFLREPSQSPPLELAYDLEARSHQAPAFNVLQQQERFDDFMEYDLREI